MVCYWYKLLNAIYISKYPMNLFSHLLLVYMQLFHCLKQQYYLIYQYPVQVLPLRRLDGRPGCMAMGSAKITKERSKSDQKLSKRSAKLINEQAIKGKKGIIFYRKNILYKIQNFQGAIFLCRQAEDEQFHLRRKTFQHRPCPYLLPMASLHGYCLTCKHIF